MASLSLTLEAFKSSLNNNNLTCKEQYDFRLLSKLLNSSLPLLQADPFNGHENEKAQLIQYTKTKGILKYKKACLFGRVFCLGGVGLRREVRYTISKQFYYDIDIKTRTSRNIVANTEAK